jgi:proteic killer suppression protein
VIKSFGDRDTQRLFSRLPVRGLPSDLHRVMLRKLVVINSASLLEDLRVPPGNQLEKLRGERAGQYSIRVNDQWRVCFRWSDGNAFDVEIVDYH